MSNELAERCNLIEECYEFMLAYAAQGVSGEEGSGRGSQIRSFLTRASEAMTGLASSLKHDGLGAFLGVVERDASDALAAVELVLAQPAISSQLVDNLNASIHLRALLTDLFLIDEVLKAKKGAVAGTVESSATPLS